MAKAPSFYVLGWLIWRTVGQSFPTNRPRGRRLQPASFGLQHIGQRLIELLRQQDAYPIAQHGTLGRHRGRLRKRRIVKLTQRIGLFYCQILRQRSSQIGKWVSADFERLAVEDRHDEIGEQGWMAERPATVEDTDAVEGLIGPTELCGNCGDDEVAFTIGVARDLPHDRGEVVAGNPKQRIRPCIIWIESS